MRKMYKKPTTEQAKIEVHYNILSASGELKQSVITPEEMSSGELG